MAHKKAKPAKSKKLAVKTKSTKKASTNKTLAGSKKVTKVKTAKAVPAKKSNAIKKEKAVAPKVIAKKAETVKLAVVKTVKKIREVIVDKLAENKEVKVAAQKAVKKIIVPQGPIFVEADKNGPKNKVRTILISQPKPESEKSPFLELARKYNVKINFRQFIQIDPVPAREFRQQRINLMEHNAVILTSRVAIDHYFRMCNEMRYTVPETTKYFCLTESIAYYLQKYVQYRKRKIFFGQQSISDLVDVIKKHKEEKFLLPVSDVHKERIVDFLDELKLNYSKATFYRTVCADLSDFNGKLDYDVVVFFTPMGIQSLKKNFPNLKQGDLRIGAFGHTTVAALRENKYRVDIAAPTKETPSMAGALENYIREVNKR